MLMEEAESNGYPFVQSRAVKKLMRWADSNILAIRPTVPDSAPDHRSGASVLWLGTTMVAKNRILLNQVQGRLHLTGGERRILAEILDSLNP